LVVGNSSLRVNEDMGRVPIRKILDLTCEILLENERKVREIGGRGKNIHTSRS